MPYTIKDFRRDYTREHLKDLTPAERLEGMSLEECLEGLSREELVYLIALLLGRKPTAKPKKKSDSRKAQR